MWQWVQTYTVNESFVDVIARLESILLEEGQYTEISCARENSDSTSTYMSNSKERHFKADQGVGQSQRHVFIVSVGAH